MQAKLKRHQETWVLGGLEMFRDTAVQLLLQPTSRKSTITQANMQSSALATRTRKLFLQNNSLFLNTALRTDLFSPMLVSTAFLIQVQSLPLSASHGFAAEL